MIHRINETVKMNELPTWLQELWELDSSLARRAEKHYLQLSQVVNMPSLHTFKERRDKLNLSLRQVAKETGVSAATISRIERNKGLCSYHNVAMLDAFYNKKYREILNTNNQ